MFKVIIIHYEISPLSLIKYVGRTAAERLGCEENTF